MKALNKRIFGIAGVTVAVLFVAVCQDAPSVHAQSTAKAITERAAELKSFRDLLRSDDPIERLAALEAGLASDDDIVRRISLEEGFGSSDKDMQSAALKMWLKSRTSIVAEVELPDRPTDAQKKLFERVAPSILLNRIEISDNGEIKTNSSYNGWNYGQFVPGGLIIKASNCDLRLMIADSKTMSGSFGCGASGNLPLISKIQ